MNTISTIRVTGPDAFEFLQGQLTNDLGRLTTEPEILAAWRNPKGRVIWFGTVWPLDDGFGLSAPAATAESIAEKLTVFRFRSKVEFAVVDDGATVDPEFLVHNGFPFIDARQSEQFTPHMLNLDLLDAVSFDKGCYTGQEIVARTHYKGASKRRTLRFTSERAVDPGDKVSGEGREIGTVLNVSGTDLLAVVPVDKADDALTVNGIKLTHTHLPYM